MIWRRKKQRIGQPSGILLVSSGGLGDTVLFSFVVNRFRTLANLGEPVSLLLPKESLKLAFLFDKKIRFFGVDYKKYRKKKSYAREINSNLYESNFRLVITTDFLRHPELDEAMIKNCDAHEAVGMEARSWPKYNKALEKNRNLYTRLFDSGPTHMDKILRWAKFADWLLDENRPLPVLRLPKEKFDIEKKFLRPTIILVPFSKVKQKQSPPETFMKIIEHLRGDFNFLVVAHKADIDSNEEYKEIFCAPDISIDLSSFQELVPKLKGSSLVISVDTAAMHLSVSLGAPTVCLASAAYVNEIVPYSPNIIPENVKFIHTAMDCAGCLGSCPLPRESDRFPCVARLDINYILKCIDEMLNWARSKATTSRPY